MVRVFSCEFCEISKNTCFTKHLWTTAYTLIPLNFIVLVKMCRIGIKSDFRKLRLPKSSVFPLFRTNYLVGYFCSNLPQTFQQHFPHRHLIWLLGQNGRTIQTDGHRNTRSNGKEGKLLFIWATSLYLAMHIYKYYLHRKWQLYGKTLNMS